VRNRTDAGMHYDASTDEKPIVYDLTFTEGGHYFSVPVKIPARIRASLGSHDFDEVTLALKQRVRGVYYNLPALCFVDTQALTRLLVVEACTFLYNRFMFAQARAGNDVWAAPHTMTEIGPPPEEDDKYMHDAAKGVLS
jgi:hypothetical protein